MALTTVTMTPEMNKQLNDDDFVLDNFLNPAVHSGDASFEKSAPWSKMTYATVNGRTVWGLPRFWYKITEHDDGGATIQISDEKLEGLWLSPAHIDRHDGKGERDFIYTSWLENLPPDCDIPAEKFITFDRIVWFSLRILFLAEFADWYAHRKKCA